MLTSLPACQLLLNHSINIIVRVPRAPIRSWTDQSLLCSLYGSADFVLATSSGTTAAIVFLL